MPPEQSDHLVKPSGVPQVSGPQRPWARALAITTVRHLFGVPRGRRPLEKHRCLPKMVGQAGCRISLCSRDPGIGNHGARRGQSESASCRRHLPRLSDSDPCDSRDARRILPGRGPHRLDRVPDRLRQARLAARLLPTRLVYYVWKHLGAATREAAAHNVKMSAEENSTAPEVSRRVLWIQALTLLWMSVEAGVSLEAAWTARSPALLAFGGDSAVELLSAAVVFRRFYAPSQRAQVEERAGQNCGRLAVRAGGLCCYYFRFDVLRARRSPAQLY